MKKILYLLVLLSFLILCYTSYRYFKVVSPLGFSCEGLGVLHHNDILIRTNYKVLMRNGNGSFTLNGIASRKNVNYPLSRQIYFSYVKEGEVYLLKSIDVSKLSFDKWVESGAEDHYPSFFSNNNKSLTLKIKQDGNGNRVFFIGSAPFLYCLR